jgi:hypothetical protein
MIARCVSTTATFISAQALEETNSTATRPLA